MDYRGTLLIDEYYSQLMYLLSEKCVHGGSSGIILQELLVDAHDKSSGISSGLLPGASARHTSIPNLVYLDEYYSQLMYLLSEKCVHSGSSGTALHDKLIDTLSKSWDISSGPLA